MLALIGLRLTAPCRAHANISPRTGDLIKRRRATPTRAAVRLRYPYSRNLFLSFFPSFLPLLPIRAPRAATTEPGGGDINFAINDRSVSMTRSRSTLRVERRRKSPRGRYLAPRPSSSPSPPTLRDTLECDFHPRGKSRVRLSLLFRYRREPSRRQRRTSAPLDASPHKGDAEWQVAFYLPANESRSRCTEQ